MKIALSDKSIVFVLSRYILGITMMAYGLIKIFQIQFVLPPEVYSYELRLVDGVTLTWAFLGFSPWFASVLGFFEVVPGFLLLFGRTKLLGAILIFPLLLAVFLVNNAYNFLPHMRFLTGVLLLLNVLLLFSGYRSIRSFLKEILSQSSGSIKETIFNTAVLLLITFLVIHYLK